MNHPRCTPVMLAAMRARGLGDAASVIEHQRFHIGQLVTRAETAERQVRDMAMENDRLRRENARLRSGKEAT